VTGTILRFLVFRFLPRRLLPLLTLFELYRLGRRLLLLRGPRTAPVRRVPSER
jgi:hypothetical protein